MQGTRGSTSPENWSEQVLQGANLVLLSQLVTLDLICKMKRDNSSSLMGHGEDLKTENRESGTENCSVQVSDHY